MTSDALRHGITPKMLRGPRFRQIFRGVHIATGLEMNASHLREAAILAMRDDARLSHESRLQALGLDVGEFDRIHFTIARDLHLARNDRSIVLHRTEVMPPTDDTGVTPAAALVQYAAHARRIEVIRVGDRLLHEDHMSPVELAEIAAAQSWRPGAQSARWCIPYLNDRSASMPETDCRVYLVAAGLPEPLVNVPLLPHPDSPIGDLWLPELRLCIEHEGRHHFTNPDQVRRDIWRYDVMRRENIAYVQAHRKVMRNPRTYVLLVHQAMLRQGYDGPPPKFGARWDALFRRGP